MAEMVLIPPPSQMEFIARGHSDGVVADGGCGAAGAKVPEPDLEVRTTVPGPDKLIIRLIYSSINNLIMDHLKAKSVNAHPSQGRRHLQSS